MTASYVIKEMGRQGDGIITTPLGALHVPKVLRGETVEIADGRLLRVTTTSIERVAPFCKHYDACGGCKFQHWAEEPYRDWKRALVVESLVRAGVNTTVAPLLDAHGEGRRRVVLHVRERDGVWRAGFMEAKTHHLTAVDICPVLVRPLARAADIAASFGVHLGACDVAITAAENGLDVAVKAERVAAQRRLASLQDIFTRFGLVRLSLNNETLFAHAAPYVAVGGAHVPVPIGGFLQATSKGEQTLAELVLAHLSKAKNVADLFCGIGPFGLRIAAKSSVHGVDADSGSVGGLLHAAKRMQGLKPVSAETRDLFRNPLVPQELNDFDSVVLDPPRAGAEAQARHIGRSKVKSVAYVSCDPQTFARDAKILIDAGFKLTVVTPVDQFKWTAHIELMGAFKR
jgi:23S rRNA (uracil1939-C5)-methyltransferase